MSNVAARSTTGCLACKTKRKKCDETKPQCLRCQKSRIECPGYTYVQRPNKPTQKPRTLPAPRTRVGRPRDRTRQSTSIDIEELHSQSQGQSPGSSVALGTSMADAETSPEVIDTSNPWVFLSSFSGSLQHPSTDFLALSGHELVATNPDPVLLPQATSDLMPMTSGQVTLLEALFSLGQPPHPVAQHPCANTSTRPASDWSPPSSSSQDDVEILEDEDPEGVVTVICRAPLPDKSVESNTLPFLLQGYATWIRRMAFEPLKMVHIARDFVFQHFADRDVSRWTLTLLANIGSRIGSVGFTEHDPMLSALHTTVRRRLDTVKSGHDSAELVKALDFALETMIIHIFVSPFSDVVTLQQEAAPIFRRLCPGPPDATIDLSLLLHHPLVCLRKYAHFDVFFNVVMDLPTLFRYDATNPGDQNLSLDEPIGTIQSETNLRWMHGTPNHLTILFARLKSMRQNGLTPDLETVLSIEREIRELEPFSGSSSESYMVIVRFVVQECWRQAAFVYLYMAVCGDSSEATRVKETFKRFKKLLQQTKPGRLPDEFLGMVLMLIAPAAQRIRDREIIRQRLLGLHSLGRTFRANNSLITVLEDYWARADAERRPIMWSDVTVSRMRVLGV